MVPDEANESAPVYVDFKEQIRAVPHKVVPAWSPTRGGRSDALRRGRRMRLEVRSCEVNGDILKAIGIENPAECGGLAHPRIVKLATDPAMEGRKHIGLEKLTAGPWSRYLGRLTPGYELEMFISAAPGSFARSGFPSYRFLFQATFLAHNFRSCYFFTTAGRCKLCLCSNSCTPTRSLPMFEHF
ncbi:hypothetical protein BDW66DRAFT_139869 [Aspergillus desertorum]